MSYNAMEQLRIVRNAYLKDLDEETLIAYSKNEPVPEDISLCQQKLRDLPSISNPQLDEFGNLDENSVSWPAFPVWWLSKKGDDRG